MVYYRYHMTHLVRFLIFASLFCAAAYADIGVVIPGDREEPDPSILTLDEVHIQVRVDNQHARVRITQIFGNHTNRIQEGKYVFAIPGDAAISDFAVWDGVVRIPGVILERKRASEIYESLRIQRIDPGLLQQDEGEEGARMASAFSARIVPIPAYGSKRLEIEYTQKINVQGTQSYFSLPLKPDLFREQKAGSVSLQLEFLSAIPFADFKFISTQYPIEMHPQGESKWQGSFEAKDILLSEDFAFQYRLDTQKSELSFLAFRGADSALRSEGQVVTAFDQPSTGKVEDGYFWASALLNEGGNANKQDPRSILILLDASSSMRWEKLEQAFAALDYFLQNLRENDEFQIILFHQEVHASSDSPLPATRANIQQALQFVKSQYLMGGTDFRKALDSAFQSASKLKNNNRYLILITDGNPTLTQIQTKKLIEHFETGNKNVNLRAFCFGVGTDTNRTFLSEVSDRSNGNFDWVTESEDLSFKLQAFFTKVGQEPAHNMTLTTSAPDLLYNVYPTDPGRIYDGSAFDWFGRYRTPSNGVNLAASGSLSGKQIQIQRTVDFPETATEHGFIPRGWARMRVDALLRKMELEGEDDASIDEIIRLAKKYKFVTPYTSFLAAPRSLLRPRAIRPGDPLLRVKTDPEIISVTAIFPFGLVKNLIYLKSEDIWQTRFLVPKEFSDGTYFCRLILRDRAGNQYEEKKSFLVDSRPPVLQARWDGTLKRGGSVRLVVNSDQDTRFIYAKLEGTSPVKIQWSNREKASVGYLKVPQDLPPGVYEIQVVGEDFAHNISRWSRKVEVY
jgi:Ca-activated chloride channel family protein